MKFSVQCGGCIFRECSLNYLPFQGFAYLGGAVKLKCCMKQRSLSLSLRSHYH